MCVKGRQLHIPQLHVSPLLLILNNLISIELQLELQATSHWPHSPFPSLLLSNLGPCTRRRDLARNQRDVKAVP
jgi:hypothetical protein